MASFIQDSNSVLLKGTATPYISVFNPYLSVIRDPQNGRPLGDFITHFEYTYNEEEVDSGKIEIETNNPNLISLTELGYQQGLQLQWGYIYSNNVTAYCGPIRKVIITSHQVNFSSSGVKITIGFSDYSILLKNAPSNYSDNTKGFVSYVTDLCKGIPIGLAMVDYNTKTVVTPKVAKKVIDGREIWEGYPHNINSGAGWATTLPVPTALPTTTISPKEMVQVPTTVIPEAVGVKILDYNSDTNQLTIDDSDNFRLVYLEENKGAVGIIIGTSRNKYYQLKDVCRSMSGGPYFLDSRDDHIVIHNAQTQRGILKVYTYEGGNGELLEFTVNSNFVKSSVEVKQSTEIDPDTKSISTTFVQGVVDPDSGNEDGKDIDTFMVWPNLASKRFNPAGVSVGKFDKSAAWQPVSGESQTSSNLIEIRTEVSQQDNHVEAEKEIPHNNDGKRSFSSIKEAQNYYNTNPGVSQEEIDQYFSKWISDWNSKKVATDSNSLAILARELDKIPPFEITRKVKIVAKVNLENLGGSMGLTSDDGVSLKQTESFINAVTSGKIDLNSYKDSWYSDPKTDRYTQNTLFMRKNYIQNATSLLSSVPGLHMSLYEGESVNSENRLVWFEATIKIVLDGIDVAAGADTINLKGSMGNDIKETITNQVKASAIVVGDPVIESSMNIQIQNVSEKYSGIWYTKKVTHIIDSNGYNTKIDFVQRTLPVSTVILKSNWSKNDYGKKLLDTIKQAKKTAEESEGYENTYKYPSYLEKMVRSELHSYPEQSTVVQVNPITGKIVVSHKDMVSGDYIPKSDGSVDYTNSGTEYLQNLQGRVNQL